MTAAPSSSTGNVLAIDSSNRPVSVKPMPNASAYGIGRRSAYKTDERLEQRSGNLIDESDETDLTEVELQACLEDGIDRRQQRLHHVVQQMAEAERPQHRHGRVEFAIVHIHIGAHARKDIALPP